VPQGIACREKGRGVLKFKERCSMNKVIVIGCPGSGKSTFSRALHEKTGLPLIHLDLLYWNEDGSTVEKSVFSERLSRAMKKDRWILDGNYASTMEARLKEADTVFFLDYPTDVCLAGIRARRGTRRPDMPFIKEQDDPAFLEFVRSFAQQSRPEILALLARYGHKKVVVFQSRAEQDAFLERVLPEEP
jgi:adenylate kinase family enzyme